MWTLRLREKKKEEDRREKSGGRGPKEKGGRGISECLMRKEEEDGKNPLVQSKHGDKGSGIRRQKRNMP